MIVIMRDAVMPECCNTCVCSEGYGCGITGILMKTKEMESRPDWCPLEEIEPCEDAGRTAVDSNGQIKRWIYHQYWEHCGECAYECPICGMGSDCDYNFCMRCGTKLARAKEDN